MLRSATCARLLGSFSFCLALASAVPAFAQDAESAAEARQQYQDGTKAYAAKRYADAALHFEAAAGFKANAVALYTAALAWDNASRPERAADAYVRALDVGGLTTAQTNTARNRVNALEQNLGTLSVTAPDGWKVQLDTLTEVNAPAKLHASAGTHTLSVRLPNKSVERRDVTLEAGRTTPLELKDEPKVAKKEPKVVDVPKPDPSPSKPASEALPPRLREHFWTTSRAVGVGVAGFGVAALVATAVLGGSANGAKDAYNAAPSQQGYDHASSMQTWTNVTLATGLVLLAGGIVLVAVPIGGDRDAPRSALAPTPRAPEVHLSAAPGGMALGGSF